MTLHQLKIFSTVAKLGSFTQAAENLHVRQPSVSLLIQGLQRELGVKLFERLGNQHCLTNAGEELLHRAEKILAEVEGIKEGMDEIKGLKKGKIRVGGVPIAMASFLLLMIQKFKKEHPDIEVVLKTQGNDGLEKELLEGGLDFAMLSWPPRSQLLLAEPYYEEEFVVIAPPKHPLVKRRNVSLEHIAKERFIAPGKGTPVRKQLEETFAKKAISFTPAIEINTQFGIRDAIRNAVASRLGIGFIAKCHVAGDIKAGRVKMLRVPELNLKRTIYIAIHQNRQASPLAQAFRDFLKRSQERR